MSYVLDRFGTLTLPALMTIEDISPVAPIDALLQTTSGVFDNTGGARGEPKFPQMVNMKTTVAQTDPNVFRTTIDALRAAVGTRDWLYRRAENNASIQKALCRLVQMPYQRQIENWATMPLDFKWQQLSPWLGLDHGVTWRFDSGEFFDSGRIFDESPPISLASAVASITLVNGGNLPCHNMIIEVKSGAIGAPLTSIVITSESTNQGIRWTGALYPSGELRIDTGAWSVLNAGVDEFNSLNTFELGQTNPYWMQLEPGANSLFVVRQGGGTDSTITFIYNDTWA